MANPKRRHTRTRRDKRRSHDALSRPNASLCSSCFSPKQPHRVCPSCGSYNGRSVLEVEELE